MELSVKKLQEHIGTNGRYCKHIHMYDMDSDEDTDYIVVMRHYIICMPKETITVNPEIHKVELMEAIYKMAESAEQNLTFHAMVDVGTFGRPFKQIMFVNEEGEKIYIQKSFFTDFYNGLFSEKTGFSEDVTFTGSKYNAPVCMWKGEDLAGLFLPIINRH